MYTTLVIRLKSWKATKHKCSSWKIKWLTTGHLKGKLENLLNMLFRLKMSWIEYIESSIKEPNTFKNNAKMYRSYHELRTKQSHWPTFGHLLDINKLILSILSTTKRKSGNHYKKECKSNLTRSRNGRLIWVRLLEFPVRVKRKSSAWKLDANARRKVVKKNGGTVKKKLWIVRNVNEGLYQFPISSEQEWMIT